MNEGQVAGTWKLAKQKGTVAVAPNLFRPLTKAEAEDLAAAIVRFRQFLGIPV
jgi:hypothetical protein